MAEVIDGVVHLYPRAIRSCRMHVGAMPYWRLCALPTWANNINDPVAANARLGRPFSASKRLEAIDELSDDQSIKIEATRILIEGGVTNLTEKRLADLLDMVKATLRTLDP